MPWNLGKSAMGDVRAESARVNQQQHESDVRSKGQDNVVRSRLKAVSKDPKYIRQCICIVETESRKAEGTVVASSHVRPYLTILLPSSANVNARATLSNYLVATSVK